MQPQRLLGIGLLVAGIILLILGIRAADSFSSQFSKFFTGSPTDRAIWMTLGGGAAIVIGAAHVRAPRSGRRTLNSGRMGNLSAVEHDVGGAIIYLAQFTERQRHRY